MKGWKGKGETRSWEKESIKGIDWRIVEKNKGEIQKTDVSDRKTGNDKQAKGGQDENE